MCRALGLSEMTFAHLQSRLSVNRANGTGQNEWMLDIEVPERIGQVYMSILVTSAAYFVAQEETRDTGTD